ncbi:hypothetical protein CP8484711_0876A, partial [Chlamydia psittaci 84-8471/1]
MHIWTSVEILC